MPRLSGKPSKELASGAPKSASLALLNRLLEDGHWLRGAGNALAEQDIATTLDLPRSSVREAVIGYINIGCLDRTSGGICRREVSSDQLVALTGERMRLEILALKRILSFSPTLRCGVADQLQTIWDVQQLLAANELSYIRWLESGFEFHQKLLECAYLPGLGILLRNIMICVRVGTFRGKETKQERIDSQLEHEAYIRLIINGVDPQIAEKDDSSWCSAIEEHIKKSVRNALKFVHMREPANFDLLWRSVREVAAGDLFSLNKHRQLFH